MATITESIGRSALLAAASNYKCVAEALMELIDNPFDKRRGRRLTIDVTIDKKGDRISILDQGGEGMNEAGLQEWIRWGEGDDHTATDIGQWRIGGKLAAIYLAESIHMVCRRANQDAAWEFLDLNWGSRTEALLEVPLGHASLSRIRWPNEEPPKGVGFTLVTLEGLKARRYEIERLQHTLAETYRSLIADGDCVIRVNGKEVEPVSIPWSTSIEIVRVAPSEVAANVHVSGQIGAIDRDQISPHWRFNSGIRTEFNGRRISAGEQFGHNLQGRNALRRLYGEIKILGEGLKPNQLKNAWPTDSAAWTEIEKLLHARMQPVANQLNSIAGSRSTSREERKWANSALERVRRAIRFLEALQPGGNALSEPEANGAQGRKRPEPRKQRPNVNERSPKGSEERRKARTPAPTDAVGRLRRLASVMPGVDYDELGPGSPRTEWRTNDDSTRTIVINRDYPLSKDRLDQDYVFEAVAQHVVLEDASTLQDYREMFDQLIWADKRAKEN